MPQTSRSGGKTTLGRITKQGDQYLRTLLVHGARTVLMNAANRPGRINPWVTQLIARRGFKKACIAMARQECQNHLGGLGSGRCLPA